MGLNNLKTSSVSATAANTPPFAKSKLRVESTSLFQGGREVVIIHQEEEYSLRITRNGKLILTK
ncbi:MAG: hemin uptake protein HemP [Candidatus Binatia bacterium]|jgi:hemin uptake protein HemP